VNDGCYCGDKREACGAEIFPASEPRRGKRPARVILLQNKTKKEQGE
jgi:hypothetical protein